MIGKTKCTTIQKGNQKRKKLIKDSRGEVTKKSKKI